MIREGLHSGRTVPDLCAIKGSLGINSQEFKWCAYSEEKAQIKDESIMMALQPSSKVLSGKVPF